MLLKAFHLLVQEKKSKGLSFREIGVDLNISDQQLTKSFIRWCKGFMQDPC
jgi:hypothetical protein